MSAERARSESIAMRDVFGIASAEVADDKKEFRVVESLKLSVWTKLHAKTTAMAAVHTWSETCCIDHVSFPRGCNRASPTNAAPVASASGAQAQSRLLPRGTGARKTIRRRGISTNL